MDKTSSCEIIAAVLYNRRKTFWAICQIVNIVLHVHNIRPPSMPPSWVRGFENQPCPAMVVSLGIRPSDRRRKFLQRWATTVTFVIYRFLDIYQLSVRWAYSLSLELIACIHVSEHHLFYVPFISFHHVSKSQLTIQFTRLWYCVQSITITASYLLKDSEPVAAFVIVNSCLFLADFPSSQPQMNW
jgi:hypothetical protein